MVVWLLLVGATEAPSQSSTAPDMLIITASTGDEMQRFKARDKFAEDLETGYPGMPNSGIARKLDRAMNASLDILMSVAKEKRSRSVVLDRIRGFLVTTRTLGLGDAENDRIVWCYGRACEILGIAIDLGELDAWLHGTASPR